MNIKILQQAFEELKDAIAYYEEQQSSLGLRFKEEFEQYKEDIDSEAPGILGQFAQIIKNYAENENGLLQSVKDFRSEMNELLGDLQAMINQFPRFDEVKQIVMPVIDDFVKTFKESLPPIRYEGQGNNPLAVIFNFFGDMERGFQI